VDEGELPLPDAAVDRVLLVHALEMSHDVIAQLREVVAGVWAAGGKLLAVVPNRRGLWGAAWTRRHLVMGGRIRVRRSHSCCARLGSRRVSWSEALYVPPIERGWFPAYGDCLGANRRHALCAVRRRPISLRLPNRFIGRSQHGAKKAPTGACAGGPRLRPSPRAGSARIAPELPPGLKKPLVGAWLVGHVRCR